MKHIFIFLIPLISFSSPPINFDVPSAHNGLRLQDTTQLYRFKAKLIDTVTKHKIDLLCDHCAMAIRFYVEPSYQDSKYIDIVVFNPNFQEMKLNKRGGTFTLKAFSRYKAPSTLIVPAAIHKNEVPLLWCDTIIPNF